jgi:hypothetical protein
MKIEMLKIILSVILFLVTQSVSNTDNVSFECLIQNDEYKYEYLYTSDQLDPADYYKRKVYTFPLQHLDAFDPIKWYLIPMGHFNDTFYIMNHQFNEYLCGSDFHLDLFELRRKVSMSKLVDKTIEHKNCEWRLEPLMDESNVETQSSNRFIIWNVKYNEPLYAASTLFKTLNYKRNVFTWHSKPNSKQFVWIVDCMSYVDLNDSNNEENMD